MVAWWTRAPPLPLPAEPLLDRLWARFVVEVPAAAAFARLAGRFGNDHLTLAALARPRGGLTTLAGVFERRGWSATPAHAELAGAVRVVQLARAGFARVLLLELDAAGLPAAARAALARLPDDPPPDDDDALAAWFGPPPRVDATELEVVARASPLGAWLLAGGRRVRSFAASAADLEGWQPRLLALDVAMDDGVLGPEDAPLRRLPTRPVELELPQEDGAVARLAGPRFELVERSPGCEELALPLELMSPSGREARRHPRVTSALSVELLYGALRVPVVSENVSQGGMFLQLDDSEAPDAHAVLQLKIELPGGAIEALATVVFRVPGRGVGVEFQWWDDEANAERRALARWLESVS